MIEIYGQPRCIFCDRAKVLCERLKLPFAYYDISADEHRKSEFKERTNGAQTVPQIFVAGTLIGGFDKFQSAVSEGIVQQMLGGK